MVFSNRASFFHIVEAVHLAGVIHNDLASRNVLVRNGQIFLIDFSHSTTHICKGRDDCPELLGLERLILRE
jgi:tRNA A-37 threonylcarbamoyl transferase component Bud32